MIKRIIRLIYRLAPLIWVMAISMMVVTKTSAINTPPPPNVLIQAPSSNSLFSAGQNIDLFVARLDWGAQLQYISIYAGSILLGSSESTPVFLTWSNVPAGIYLLTAIALDVNGRYGTSAPVPIQVATPPANDDWQN